MHLIRAGGHAGLAGSVDSQGWVIVWAKRKRSLPVGRAQRWIVNLLGGLGCYLSNPALWSFSQEVLDAVINSASHPVALRYEW